jgi:MFS family permease
MPLLFLFAAQGTAFFTGQILEFAMIWQALNWWHSPLLISGIAAAGTIANLILTPWIGHMVDRTHRLKIVAMGHGISMVGSLGLVASLPMILAHKIGVTLLISFYTFRIVGRQIQSTAFIATISGFGSNTTRGKLIARWQTTTSASRLLSAPLSATLIAIISIKYFLFIDVAATAIALLNAWHLSRIIPIHETKDIYQSDSRVGTVFGGLIKTWKFLERDKILITFLLALPILNFIGTPVGTLIPAIIKFDWKLGAQNLAFAEILATSGILISSTLQSITKIAIKPERFILINWVSLTISMMMIGGWDGAPPLLLYAGMFICGFSVMGVYIPLQATVATRTPESMRGRVAAIMYLLGGVSTPVGLMIVGSMAQVFGTRFVFWISTVIYAILICILVMRVGSSAKMVNANSH